MNDDKYFENIRMVEGIIAKLDEGKISPEEAKKLFESAKDLIRECESILNCYSGTIEEINLN
jgi:exodeoxyribonuclease VII small subunit